MAKAIRWVPWVIALFSAAFGGWIWRESSENPLITRVDRAFQDWLVEKDFLRRHPTVPVTLVEMEDAENWTALEYTLFLKAIPKDDVPVVVLESLPADDNTAFDRAFRDLAIQQPRLILPVALSRAEKAEENTWWLDGWKNETGDKSAESFTAVDYGPPETLRGTTAVGVVNFPTKETDPLRAAAYFSIGETILPSLALRAIMLSWKVAPAQVSMSSGLVLDRQHLPVAGDGTFAVDLSFLPGIRRVASSDLLLRLEANEAQASGAPLRGVVVLGNISEAERKYAVPSGQKLSRAELLAASVASLGNGPFSFPASQRTLLLVLLASAGLPLLFRKSPGWAWAIAFLVVPGVYLLFCIFLASRLALVLPLFMPVAVFALGHGLNSFARHSKHARPSPAVD